jgi:hypothetical protein
MKKTKKKAPKMDFTQTALAAVEAAIGGPLVNDKPLTRRSVQSNPPKSNGDRKSPPPSRASS